MPDGPYKGKGEGPEYETISSLGTARAVSATWRRW
ncbi:MAG: aldehyde ferredoxin oxidoreductase C-terminal domain-containing protein [Candidatus Moduliflexus flocculans]|nr:aldehyde ferredoxin oxidoreductase C-terminal domain-containing protein [Candidatus Moduliflexus flocculans]